MPFEITTNLDTPINIDQAFSKREKQSITKIGEEGEFIKEQMPQIEALCEKSNDALVDFYQGPEGFEPILKAHNMCVVAKSI